MNIVLQDIITKKQVGSLFDYWKNGGRGDYVLGTTDIPYPGATDHVGKIYSLQHDGETKFVKILSVYSPSGEGEYPRAVFYMHELNDKNFEVVEYVQNQKGVTK